MLSGGQRIKGGQRRQEAQSWVGREHGESCLESKATSQSAGEVREWTGSAARPGLSQAFPEAVAKQEHLRWGSCEDNLEVTWYLAPTIRGGSHD